MRTNLSTEFPPTGGKANAALPAGALGRRGDSRLDALEARVRAVVAQGFARHGVAVPGDDAPCGAMFHYLEVHADLHEQLGVDLSELDWADTVGQLVSQAVVELDRAGHA